MAHRTVQRLDPVEDLVAVEAALHELADRAQQTGDRGTALLARDAAEAVIALADRLLYVERTVSLRDRD